MSLTSKDFELEHGYIMLPTNVYLGEKWNHGHLTVSPLVLKDFLENRFKPCDILINYCNDEDSVHKIGVVEDLFIDHEDYQLIAHIKINDKKMFYKFLLGYESYYGEDITSYNDYTITFSGDFIYEISNKVVDKIISINKIYMFRDIDVELNKLISLIDKIDFHNLSTREVRVLLEAFKIANNTIKDKWHR